MVRPLLRLRRCDAALVLLSEVWRWTGDAEVAEGCRSPRLLRCGGSTSSVTGTDGFVEYARRTPRGLENQSWKDSGDSQRFHDGAFAAAPVAPCEVQGYVYDAKLRITEVARAAWQDDELASRLESEAEDLQRRFDDAYWVEERGGFYALALDGEKRAVDSLCSNTGHLLWSGIVPRERVKAVAGAADGRGALVGVGDTDDVDRGRCLQPAQLPQRHRLAPRHLARCVGARTRRSHGGAAPDRACAPRGGAVLRLVAAGGVRRLRARRDAVPDRLPDGGAATSVGGRHACAAVAAPARTRARSRGARAAQRDGAARLGKEGLELDGIRAFGQRWNVLVVDGEVVVQGSGE